MRMARYEGGIPMRVLLIDHDQSVVQPIRLLMAAQNHVLDVVDVGEDGIHVAKDGDYDIILLGNSLPDMSGIDVIRALRTAKARTPIVFMSLDMAMQHRVAALNAGADDFLLRPFAVEELVARMQAIVRRAKGFSQNVLNVGMLSMNLDSQTCVVNGHPVHLTQREWAIVQLLAMRKGHCITKDMVLDNVYGGMDEPESKIVDVFICKIRKKFAACGAGHMIETVWGRGYMLRVEDAEDMPFAKAA